MIVAFRSAKVASVIATFAEQKATPIAALAIGSQPNRESSVFSHLFAERKATLKTMPNIIGPNPLLVPETPFPMLQVDGRFT
jgi:hypothetical protein